MNKMDEDETSSDLSEQAIPPTGGQKMKNKLSMRANQPAGMKNFCADFLLLI